MSEELINAIENSDSNLVLELLKNEADPNYWDGSTLPLLCAIENVNKKNDQAKIILQNLLNFGANPFQEFYQDEEDYFTCPLEYVLENDFAESFELIFAHIKKTNCLSYMTLEYAAKASSELLLFLIKEGVHNNSERALTRRLDYYDDIKYPDITILDFTAVKELYELGGIKFSDHIYYYYLFIFALVHGRYSFAYQLYMISDVQTGVYEEYYSEHRVSWLLTADQPFDAMQPSEVDKHRIALILSCLCENNGSFTKVINNSKNNFQDNDSPKMKNEFHKDLVSIIESINNRLFNAVVIFLNPVQNTFFEILPVDIRFKLANEYLRNEIGSLIHFLDDHKLTEILSYRILHYYYVYRKIIYQNAVSEKITSLNSSTDFKIKFHTSMTTFLNNNAIFEWSLAFRQNFFAQLDHFKNENIDLSYLNHLQKIYFDLHKKEASKKFLINNSIYRTVINGYSLRYLIKKKDTNSVMNLLNTDPIWKNKSLTDLMHSIENDNTDILKLSEESFTWFEHFMLHYCIKNYEENTLEPILDSYEDRISEKKILEMLLQSKKISLFEKFLKKSRCHYTEYLSLIGVYCLSHTEENILTALMLKIIEKQTYDMYREMGCRFEERESYESYLTNMLHSIMAPIFNKKKSSLIRLALQIFMTSPISSQLETELKPYTLVSELSLSKDVYSSKDNTWDTVSTEEKLLKKTLVCKYVLPLVYYRDISNCLAACLPQDPLKKPMSLAWSPRDNYNKLIKILREPTYLPKTCYDNFMVEKGTDRLSQMPQILTQREKLVYLTLMRANWKLTHRVKKYEDFLKIQREGKILSIAQRKKQNLAIDNKHTADLPSERFVFLTVGPEKSPCPRFLKDSGGFEIDINQLLQKYPDFLDYGYLTFHLYAFAANQSNLPRIFNEKVWNIHFSGSKQYNEYYHEDEKYSLVYDMSDGVFSGKRVTHILSLLFIQNLRTIAGSVYEYVLQNANNIQILSDVFCEIIHPGLFEFRYPGAVPLDNSYTNVLSFSTEKKYYQEWEIEKAFVSSASLQAALKDGLDIDQAILLTYQIKNKKYYDVGNFLTWAILKNKADIVQYLLDYTKPCLTNFNYTLTPFEAAKRISDGKTLLKLLHKGTYISHGIREFPFIYEDVLNEAIYSYSLDNATLTLIVKSIHHSCSLGILRSLISKYSILLQNRIAILPLIQILLQNLLSNEQYARTKQILAQICMYAENDVNAFAFAQSLVVFLDLLGPCQNELYDKIVSFITQERVDVREDNNDWTDQECIQIFLTELLKNSHFRNYLKNLRRFKDFFKLLKNKLKNLHLIDATKYLIEIDHKYKDYFIANWLEYVGSISQEEFDPLFTLLTDIPQCQLKLFEMSNFMFSEKVLACIAPMISFYNTHYRDYLTLDLILTSHNVMISALEVAIKNNCATNFITLLLFITDREERVHFFFKHISEDIKSFIVNNINCLIPNINQTLHPCKDRLKRILQELTLESPPDIAMNRTEIWLKGIKQTDDAPKEASSLSLWESRFLQAIPRKQNPLLTCKSAAVILITCHMNNEPHVFLGRKKNLIIREYLLAPGGRVNANEDSLSAAIREAVEETRLDIHASKEAINILQYLLKKVGGKTFCKPYNDTNTLLPESISLLHRYERLDNFSGQEKLFRTIFFYWFELSPAQNKNLIASDDFSDGIWLPISCLKYRPEASGYYCNDLKVLGSNAMLIEMIQGKPISRTLLDEEIYFERYSFSAAQKITQFSKIFSENATNAKTSKRKIDSAQQNDENEKKLKNSN